MSNLKPFDLERWKAGDKIQYRDGKEVIDMHYFDHQLVSWPIHALAWDGSFTAHTQDGGFSSLDSEHVRDIVMSPKKVKYWFASRPSFNANSNRSVTGMYEDLEALKAHNPLFVKAENAIIHEIEIEE